MKDIFGFIICSVILVFICVSFVAVTAHGFGADAPWEWGLLLGGPIGVIGAISVILEEIRLSSPEYKAEMARLEAAKQEREAAKKAAREAERAERAERNRRNLILKLPPGNYPIYNCLAGDGVEQPGYVYVVSSPRSFAGLYKIGMTTRPVKERVAELNNAGIPYPYQLNLVLATQNARKAEAQIHNALSRWSENKEFFRISAAELTAQLSRLVGKPIKLH